MKAPAVLQTDLTEFKKQTVKVLVSFCSVRPKNHKDWPCGAVIFVSSSGLMIPG